MVSRTNSPSVVKLGRPPLGAVDMVPDDQNFDHALKAPSRPVPVSLQRPPFRDFSVEEFPGHSHCPGPNGCVSAFKGNTLTRANWSTHSSTLVGVTPPLGGADAKATFHSSG